MEAEQKVNLQPLRQALLSLEDILIQPINPYIRDGVIQRFEFTFELAWKAMQRLLKLRGVATASPATVFRAAAAEGLIPDADPWLAFLKARNLTVHTYNEAVAAEVYLSAQAFPAYVTAVLGKLQPDAA